MFECSSIWLKVLGVWFGLILALMFLMIALVRRR